MSMLGWFGKNIGPIGIDLGNGYLQMAQIGTNGHGLYLHAAGVTPRPAEIEPQSPAWQRWAIDAIKDILNKGGFNGKSVITAISTDDLYVEPVKAPRQAIKRLEEAVLPIIQKRLPFAPQEGIIQYIPVEPGPAKGTDVDVIVVGSPRCKIDRHLAIYEKAGLEVAEMSIWPTAVMNSYCRFFCRRKNDQGRIVMLLDIDSHNCNVIVGRGSELLFVRVIPIGTTHLEQGPMMHRLIAEIDSCCRYYDTIGAGFPIERILLLVGSNVDKTFCDQIAELAQKMQIPAQIGDVLSAIEIRQGLEAMVDRRNSNVDWSIAFGLSLEGIKEKQ